MVRKQATETGCTREVTLDMEQWKNTPTLEPSRWKGATGKVALER